MKVNVTQATELSFKRWRLWSNWIDISILECGHSTYLIQMKVSRTNKKKFRTVKLANVNCTIRDVGDLTQMSQEAA